MKSFLDFLNGKYRVFMFVPRWVVLIMFFFFYLFIGHSVAYTAISTVVLAFIWYVIHMMIQAKRKTG